jgi:hypothetical protein
MLPQSGLNDCRQVAFSSQMKIIAFASIGLLLGSVGTWTFSSVLRFNLTPATIESTIGNQPARPVVFKLDRWTGKTWVYDFTQGDKPGSASLVWIPCETIPSR